MATQAQIRSVEAIEQFRAALIQFAAQARPALEEVSSDVMRTRLWMENDQWRHWQAELRNRNKKLEQAQSELLTARMSDFQESTSLQLLAVRRAREKAQQAGDKLKLLKKWDHDLENRAAPLLKEIEQLHSYLAGELPKAVAYLAQIVKTLDAYAEARGGAAGPAPGPGGPKP